MKRIIIYLLFLSAMPVFAGHVENIVAAGITDTALSSADTAVQAITDSLSIPAAPVAAIVSDAKKDTLEHTPNKFLHKTLHRDFYDRGTTNYLFIPAKEWMFGLTVSYKEYDSDDIQLLSLIKDFNFKGQTFEVNPFIGYFIKDNAAIGLRLGYSKIDTDLGNVSLHISDDMSFDINGLGYAEDQYSAALFYRTYVGLDQGKRFGLFNEVSLAFTSASSRFVRGNNEEARRTRGNSSEIKLGFSPGLSVFIMNNISANVSFSVAGLRYSYSKQTFSDGSTGSRHNSGMDFKINILNINIGVTVHI